MVITLLQHRPMSISPKCRLLRSYYHHFSRPY